MSKWNHNASSGKRFYGTAAVSVYIKIYGKITEKLLCNVLNFIVYSFLECSTKYAILNFDTKFIRVECVTLFEKN